MDKRRPTGIDNHTSLVAWLAQVEKQKRDTGQQNRQPKQKKGLPHLLLGGVLVLQLLVMVAVLILSAPIEQISKASEVTAPLSGQLLETKPADPLPTFPPPTGRPLLEPTVTALPETPLVPTTALPTPTPSPTEAPPTLPAILTFRGVEITQGIQVFNEPEHARCSPDPDDADHLFCNNSVPLVTGRHTLLRIYPACHGVCPPSDITIRLRVLKDDQEQAVLTQRLPAETLRRVHNLPPAEMRFKLDNSVNFEFFPPPPRMSGRVTFELEAIPANPAEAAPATFSLTKNFEVRKPLRVAYLPIQVQGLVPPEPANADYWLLRIYPVSGVAYYRLPVPDLVLEQELSKASLLNKLLFTYWLYAQYQPVAEWPDQLFGWLPKEVYNGGVSDPFWCPTCSGPHSSRVAFGGLRPEQDIGAPRILAHEIAHNLGALHAWSPTQQEDPACFKAEGANIRVDPEWPYAQTPHIQEFGIDLYSNPPVVYPPGVYDMMAYCTRPWISPYTYRKLFDSPFLQPDATAATLPLANFQPQAETTAGNTLLVSGVIYPNGTVSQPEIVRLEGNLFAGDGQAFLPPAFGPPSGNDYCLNIETGPYETLARHCFEAGFTDLETGQPSDASPYFFAVPNPAGRVVSQVSISRNQSPVVVVRPSNTPPEVAVTVPNGGEVLTGHQTVTWEAHDADNDTLLYDLLYSADGGQSWLPLAVRLSRSSYTFDTGQIPASNNALVRVIVSDGFHTVFDQSDASFTVRPPAENSLHLQGPATVKPDQSFAVTVAANQITEPGLFGVQFKVQFDPAMLQVNNLSLHPDLNLSAVETIDNSTGQVLVVASRRGQVPNLTGDLTLATLNLTAIAGPGETYLHLSDVSAGDRAATRLTLGSQGFSLSIGPVPNFRALP